MQYYEECIDNENFAELGNPCRNTQSQELLAKSSRFI